MICKIWRWKGTPGWEDGGEHTSQICTPSPVKSIAFGNWKSFMMFCFEWAKTEYAHLRVKVWRSEIVGWWRQYDIINDCNWYYIGLWWDGRKVISAKHRSK